VFATGDTLDELRASLEEGISLYLTEPDQDPPKVILSELSWDEPLRTQAHAGLQYA
jgi:predicted RNase H-like HicB family nuclease